MADMPSNNPTPEPATLGRESQMERQIKRLKRRLFDEATVAVSMLESALDALFALDADRAGEIRRHDDRIDSEEVAIEEESFRIMTLRQPVGHDFRVIAFVLKVNQDVERIADNACSIAKMIRRLDPADPPQWPTALKELAQRVPMCCHALLRAAQDEDVDAAADLVKKDEAIDRMERRLFDETIEMMRADPSTQTLGAGLLIARVGRALERVGDLLANIAEDIVYLHTGTIVRHTKQRQDAAPGGNESQSDG